MQALTPPASTLEEQCTLPCSVSVYLKTDVLEKAGQNEGFERSYRASVDRIESLSIKLPPLTDSRKLLSKLNGLKLKLQALKKIMAQTGERRNS